MSIALRQLTWMKNKQTRRRRTNEEAATASEARISPAMVLYIQLNIIVFVLLFNFHKYFSMAQDGTIEQTWSTFSSCYGCVI